MAELPSITCPRCGRTSIHPQDVADRYCSHCHKRHPGLEPLDLLEQLSVPAPPTYQELLQRLRDPQAGFASDAVALAGDWGRVGDDLWAAIAKVQAEQAPVPEPDLADIWRRAQAHLAEHRRRMTAGDPDAADCDRWGGPEDEPSG